MVGDIGQGEFFMHVSDGSILQKLKSLVTSFQLTIKTNILNPFQSLMSPLHSKAFGSNFCIQ